MTTTMINVQNDTDINHIVFFGGESVGFRNRETMEAFLDDMVALGAHPKTTVSILDFENGDLVNQFIGELNHLVDGIGEVPKRYVRCVENVGFSDLSANQVYEALKFDKDGDVKIVDDSGSECWYSSEQLEEIYQDRNITMYIPNEFYAFGTPSIVDVDGQSGHGIAYWLSPIQSINQSAKIGDMVTHCVCNLLGPKVLGYDFPYAESELLLVNVNIEARTVTVRPKEKTDM
ncbi:hypothetical protein [Alicyclobacillus fodiniaquatilis]|uniref:Uncharacterized protein n=1 Tax=Alicyclobacillus fodiniaquatilis TaxID=1661150 RepID=A0ABW4JKS8_9BACL